MKVKFYRRRIKIRPEWRWKIIADNNRTIGASSEGYLNKKEALDNFTQVTGRDLLTGAMPAQDAIRGSADVSAWDIEIIE